MIMMMMMMMMMSVIMVMTTQKCKFDHVFGLKFPTKLIYQKIMRKD